MNELEKEIEKLENELEEKRKELERIVHKQETEKNLAIQLHEHLCKRNHTDNCSWKYEIKNGYHDWNDYAHKKYLKKAKILIEYCDKNNIVNYEHVIYLIKFIREIENNE